MLISLADEYPLWHFSQRFCNTPFNLIHPIVMRLCARIFNQLQRMQQRLCLKRLGKVTDDGVRYRLESQPSSPIISDQMERLTTPLRKSDV
jgi:hypothetical protein